MLVPVDTALIAETNAKIHWLVTEFGSICIPKKLHANVRNSKMIRCSRENLNSRINVELNNEVLKKVEKFKHLRATMAINRVIKNRCE